MHTEYKPTQRVAVIGAGIAGLAAAYELTKQGIDVTVFEKAEKPGGRMVTTHVDGLMFDAGAAFFSDNYTQMRSYAEEFGIPWIPYEHHCAQRFMRNGKTHILHLRGIHDILNQPLLSWGARAALLRWLIQVRAMPTELDFFDLSTVPSELDTSTAADYVTHHVHPEINDYITDPFTGAMQFHRTDEMSAAAMIALLHMTLSPTRKFTPRYTQGGMAAIAHALADRLPIEYNSNIQSITHATNGIDLHFTDREVQSFDRVILATPSYVTRKLLQNPSQNLSSLLNSVEYAATITVAVEVPAGIADGSHCTYVPFKEHALIGSYTFEENKHNGFARNGRAVMNVYLREAAARELMDEADEVIYRHVITELQTICPELRGHTTSTRGLALHRWPMAMPKFNYRYISTVRNYLQDYQGENGIYLAGDYLNAPWTEGASRSGIRAGKAVAESLNLSGYSLGSAAISSSSVGAVLPS